MALDSRTVDISPLRSLAVTMETVLFNRDGLDAETGVDPKVRARAEETLNLWSAVCLWPQACLMVLRGADRFSVASGQGGMIVEAAKPFNVGLLRRIVRPLDHQTAPAPIALCTEAFSPAQHVIWNLAQRLSRVEATRRMDLRIGDENFLLEASQGSISVLERPGGLTALVRSIEGAIPKQEPVRFKLVSPDQDLARTHHEVAELFAPDPASAEWQVGPNGWPLGVTPGANFEQVQAISTICQILHCTDISRLDLLETTGRVALSLAKSGETFRVSYPQPSQQIAA